MVPISLQSSGKWPFTSIRPSRGRGPPSCRRGYSILKPPRRSASTCLGSISTNKVAEYSMFSVNRHGRFSESDTLAAQDAVDIGRCLPLAVDAIDNSVRLLSTMPRKTEPRGDSLSPAPNGAARSASGAMWARLELLAEVALSVVCCSWSPYQRRAIAQCSGRKPEERPQFPRSQLRAGLFFDGSFLRSKSNAGAAVRGAASH
jgi:hypothetical protein